ncbi:hypothetical protein [Crocinitomix algicola]|uniref:hypothetical protein n=1 Tax=Crocinitomix algicola TaxID=1740263 RepID=UPI00082D4512|nr:hypothetical protein [Crocinitomix algicola]
MAPSAQKTLSELINELAYAGFNESFIAKEKYFQGIYTKKSYRPENLKILGTYRFEGDTNPADQATLFAIEAENGTKGTLVMNYSYAKNQNDELIKQLKERSRAELL